MTVIKGNLCPTNILFLDNVVVQLELDLHFNVLPIVISSRN